MLGILLLVAVLGYVNVADVDGQRKVGQFWGDKLAQRELVIAEERGETPAQAVERAKRLMGAR